MSKGTELQLISFGVLKYPSSIIITEDFELELLDCVNFTLYGSCNKNINYVSKKLPWIG